MRERTTDNAGPARPRRTGFRSEDVWQPRRFALLIKRDFLIGYRGIFIAMAAAGGFIILVTVLANLGRGVVTVVPLTSNVDRIYPFQVVIEVANSGLTIASKAQAEQVRSIAAQRLVARLGRISPAELTALDDALRLHLSL